MTSALLDTLAFLAYPLAVWWIVTAPQGSAPVWLLLIAMLPRTVVLLRRSSSISRRQIIGPPLAIAVLVSISALTDDTRYVMLLPVLIAATLLYSFGRSLAGTSMVESYARLLQPELTPAEVTHCRQATWVWCGFFVLNGGLSAWLATFADPTAWALYTGLYSYVLMAALFAAEYAVRVWRFGLARATPSLRRPRTP